MKQGYEYNDGKVYIYDENFKSIEREYQDNIEEIIKKENEVEFLEKKLNKLKEDNIELEKKLEDKTISWTIIRYIGLVIIILLSLPIIGSLLLQRNLNDLMYLLGGFKNYLNTFLPIVSFGVFPLCLNSCNKINNYKKEKSSVEAQIEYIESYLKELEIELKKIKCIKVRDNEPNAKTIKKIPFSNIRVMKAILALIEDAGYEEKKYLEYLRKGILRKKLSQDYKENEINVIEYYIDKKAKSLEKKH